MISLTFSFMSNIFDVWYVFHVFDLYKLILFSSWVSNGVVGSPAFAAFDQGLLHLQSKCNLKNMSMCLNCKYAVGFLLCRIRRFPWESSGLGV